MQFLENSELNGMVGDVLDEAMVLERDRVALTQIKQEKTLRKQQRWQKRSKLWPFKARLMRLRHEGYFYDDLVALLKQEYKVLVDRSTLSRQLRKWLEEEEEKKTRVVCES